MTAHAVEAYEATKAAGRKGAGRKGVIGDKFEMAYA